MATAWMRSLSCKSTAVADDVYSSPKPQPRKRPPPVKGSDGSLPAWQRSSSRDQLGGLALARTKRGASSKPGMEKKNKPKHARQKLAASSPGPSSAAAFLAMTELPEGHSSRRVVELIFASGWGADDAPEVDALFRVHATARAEAHFEDARRAAARAPGANARCAADGNEMMRFQCLATDDATGEVICAAVATCRLGSAVRTFASSGAAHAGAGAGGEEPSRMRGMLVCRVVAGRVRRAEEEGCDSVDNGGGELVVLDSRAVLPCFLVVYSTSRR